MKLEGRDARLSKIGSTYESEEVRQNTIDGFIAALKDSN
jgi:hypothetical protein